MISTEFSRKLGRGVEFEPPGTDLRQVPRSLVRLLAKPHAECGATGLARPMGNLKHRRS
jgi:hypothetical protein